MELDITALIAALGSKKEKAPTPIPAIATATIMECVAGGKRLTYSQFGALLVKTGAIQKMGPQAFNFLGQLPKEVQYAVTNNDGSYHANALAKWSEQAPEGYATRPVATNEEFVEFVKAAIAKK